MREFMTIAKALADEKRVRMLLALGAGELCLCQITELFRLAPSTVSKHLSLLKQAGLVETRKEGRWMFFRINDADMSDQGAHAIAWVRQSLQSAPQVREDARRLRRILRIPRGELCRRQSRSRAG